jgi:anti-anti-sigma factor
VTLAWTALETDSTIELALFGEWDLAQRDVVGEAISAALKHHPGHVVLDLSGVTFMDSSGVHGVCEVNDRCAQQTIELMIIPGPRPVQRLFEICGVAEQLPFLQVAQ